MAEVKILIEGYAKKTEGGWLASPSSVLIEDSGKKILADPGSNRKLLLEALSKEDLSPKDIDIVFLTHHHLDHLLNIRLFPEHDIYDGDEINKDDLIINYSEKIPGTNIQVIATPGHSSGHASLLVETDKGKICIAGDLWWWIESKEQKTDMESLMNHEDPYVKDKELLKKSRKKILELADYIIPGHGKIFKVKKE